MTKLKNTQHEVENVLLALDQLGQTIDIMNCVMSRLRGHLTQCLHAVEQVDVNHSSAAIKQPADTQSDAGTEPSPQATATQDPRSHQPRRTTTSTSESGTSMNNFCELADKSRVLH